MRPSEKLHPAVQRHTPHPRRTCLRCGKSFAARGLYHRICPHCHLLANVPRTIKADFAYSED